MSRRYRACLRHQSIGRDACNKRIYLVLGVLDGILADELELDKLQQLLCVRDAVEDGAQVHEGPVVVDARESGECVPLAGGVGLGLEEGTDELGGIGDKGGGVLEDRCDGEDCILANVGVAVLKALPCGGKQRLDKLGLAQLGEEAQRVAADVLVGVLEVISDAVAVGNVGQRAPRAVPGSESPTRQESSPASAFRWSRAWGRSHSRSRASS